MRFGEPGSCLYELAATALSLVTQSAFSSVIDGSESKSFLPDKDAALSEADLGQVTESISSIPDLKLQREVQAATVVLAGLNGHQRQSVSWEGQ